MPIEFRYFKEFQCNGEKEIKTPEEEKKEMIDEALNKAIEQENVSRIRESNEEARQIADLLDFDKRKQNNP